MRFDISLRIVALMLPALIVSAAPAEITTPSELLPTRDLALNKIFRGTSTPLPIVSLKQSYVNENYKGYDVVDGWAVSKTDDKKVTARAVTRLDGERIKDKAIEIEKLGYLLEDGEDDSGRYWIVYRVYMSPHELEDEYEPAEYEKMPVTDIDSYFT